MRIHLHMSVHDFAALVFAVLALAVVAFVAVRSAWAVHAERVRAAVRRFGRRGGAR